MVDYNLSKCRSWFHMTSCSLGLFVGLAGFLVFTFVYSNYQAGFIALASGVLSTVCLHLHILNHFDIMGSWYTPGVMRRITVFAALVLITVLALMAWYLSQVITRHEGFYPIETSNPARAVMSFMCTKWAISLLWFSVSFRRQLIEQAFSYQSLAEENEPSDA